MSEAVIIFSILIPMACFMFVLACALDRIETLLKNPTPKEKGNE